MVRWPVGRVHTRSALAMCRRPSLLCWRTCSTPGIGGASKSAAPGTQAKPAPCLPDRRSTNGLNLHTLAADTCGMAEKPEPPPQLTAWSVYKIAKKAAWLGIVEAPDEATAIEKAAAEFKVPTNRLLVVRR
jgi:hypothetical protein